MTTTFGLFNTSVMGMAAQSDALAAISENIANSGTIGYKEATTHFLTVLNGYQNAEVFGGGVMTRNRYEVPAQGALQHTSSGTDLGIRGNGFFVVSDGAGEIFLTRAGSFVVDAQGRLVNSAGYYLMGFDAAKAPTGPTSNALTSMSVVRIQTDKMYAAPTTKGTFAANLPAAAAAAPAAKLPSTNMAGAQFSAKSSVTVYDSLGNSVVLDVYFAKTGPNAWEATFFNQADAAAGGGFPYATGPLTVQNLTFDPATGSLSTGSPVSIAVPGGTTMSLDLGEVTQLGAPFAVNSVYVDGSAASSIRQIDIGSDGTVSYKLTNGQSAAVYKIGLASVNSPVNLTSQTGNVFSANEDSGQIFVGNPGTGGFGSIMSSQLESSTVDLATQLSSMIIAQRAFTANSQVFQVASDVLQVLNNLK